MTDLRYRQESRCPVCGAQPGERCTYLADGGVRVTSITSHNQRNDRLCVICGAKGLHRVLVGGEPKGWLCEAHAVEAEEFLRTDP